MANNINEIDSYMHKFSRTTTANGQVFTDQATAKSGHNVSYVEVRADDVPICRDINARNIQLLTTNTDGQRIVKEQYSSILKFWDKAPLTVYDNTNNEAWCLLDNTGIPISNFIDPTDELIDGRYLSNGYLAVLYDENGNKISPNYGWTFESYSGLVKFQKGKTPVDMGWGIPKIEVFSYIGKNTKEYFKNIDFLISSYYNLLIQLENSQIAVQPYQYSTNKMELSGEPFVFPGAFNRFGKPMWAQTYQITIPGYVFETTAVDSNETIIVDYNHTEDGDSIVKIDVEIDPVTGLPIQGYNETTDADGNHILTKITGPITFKSATFKRHDGQKISTLPLLVLGINNPDTELNPVDSSIIEDVENRQYLVNFGN